MWIFDKNPVTGKDEIYTRDEWYGGDHNQVILVAVCASPFFLAFAIIPWISESIAAIVPPLGWAYFLLIFVVSPFLGWKLRSETFARYIIGGYIIGGLIFCLWLGGLFEKNRGNPAPSPIPPKMKFEPSRFEMPPKQPEGGK